MNMVPVLPVAIADEKISSSIKIKTKQKQGSVGFSLIDEINYFLKNSIEINDDCLS